MLQYANTFLLIIIFVGIMQIMHLCRTLLRYQRRLLMKNVELVNLLNQEVAEENELATLITGLLTTIQDAENVPQDVADAANAVKTGLDNLKTQAAGTAAASEGGTVTQPE